MSRIDENIGVGAEVCCKRIIFLVENIGNWPDAAKKMISSKKHSWSLIKIMKFSLEVFVDITLGKQFFMK